MNGVFARPSASTHNYSPLCLAARRKRSSSVSKRRSGSFSAGPVELRLRLCKPHYYPNTKKHRSATPRRPGGESHPQFEPHSRTEGGHGPGGIWRVGPSSILSMADSEAALKSRPCVAFIIRSALVCLETGNPWMTTKGTDTKAASKSRRWVAFSSGRPWFAWRQGQPVDGDERN